ncbi:ferrochelatase [Pseudogulbenkiania subflava]|uniref:Ferrochelatase n=1 Tax=Pseudogulbenkiania subflava DSM 22618 TaxID=1123014 RepID=A0A1Y6CE66_9NEIS|nr:ferrochelatase [Pseudogulbenkiania subflava]SMF49551.1 ferrochelatase [Pseudogulbenkiania subflava DSM 22618]
MSLYNKEPAFQHDYTPKTGVLLLNLGTPDAPTGKALRPYLKQFLSDPRVVELPRALWWLILNGIILNTRPRKSAEKYAAIWGKEGSPLLAHTQRQTKLLRGYLGENGHRNLVVDFAMRYGFPSVEQVITGMRSQGVERLLVVPLYPQYAASSSATALDDVFRTLMKLRNMPELRTVRHFHDDPGYIRALAEQVRAHWQRHGRADKLVMSFHGVPRFTLDKGDPYHCECQKTGRLLAEELGLGKDQYVVCFQSRFGRAEWLKPYTSEVLAQLGKNHTARVDVICPGFVSDCLETLEEMAMEGKETFLTHGGGEYRYIPCLNDSPQWIAALAGLVEKNLAGWESLAAEPAEQRLLRARSIGATK